MFVICLYVYLSVYLFACFPLSVCRSVWLAVCLSVSLSVCPTVSLRLSVSVVQTIGVLNRCRLQDNIISKVRTFSILISTTIKSENKIKPYNHISDVSTGWSHRARVPSVHSSNLSVEVDGSCGPTTTTYSLDTSRGKKIPDVWDFSLLCRFIGLLTL